MTVQHEATTVHPIPKRLLDASKNPVPHVNSMEKYKAMWKESVEKPDQFFGNVSLKSIKKKMNKN
jgi:acetyl-CoA synthetase